MVPKAVSTTLYSDSRSFKRAPVLEPREPEDGQLATNKSKATKHGHTVYLTSTSESPRSMQWAKKICLGKPVRSHWLLRGLAKTGEPYETTTSVCVQWAVRDACSKLPVSALSNALSQPFTNAIYGIIMFYCGAYLESSPDRGLSKNFNIFNIEKFNLI